MQMLAECIISLVISWFSDQKKCCLLNSPKSQKYSHESFRFERQEISKRRVQLKIRTTLTSSCISDTLSCSAMLPGLGSQYSWQVWGISSTFKQLTIGSTGPSINRRCLEKILGWKKDEKLSLWGEKDPSLLWSDVGSGPRGLVRV